MGNIVGLLPLKLMTMKSKKLLTKPSLSSLYVCYTVAYGAVRSSNWLIHRVGYYSEADQSRRVAGHYIFPGDFGVPVLAQGVGYIFFLPATKVELVFWHLIVPQGTPWQPKA
jgi:hypothetical protein